MLSVDPTYSTTLSWNCIHFSANCMTLKRDNSRSGEEPNNKQHNVANSTGITCPVSNLMSLYLVILFKQLSMFRTFLAHPQEFLHCMVSRNLWQMCGCVVVLFGIR
jgi:hypothetical protein